MKYKTWRRLVNITILVVGPISAITGGIAISGDESIDYNLQNHLAIASFILFGAYILLIIILLYKDPRGLNEDG